MATETETTAKTNEDDNEDFGRCGIGGWSPDWLQIMSSKKAYMFSYGLLGMTEVAVSTYFAGVISTVEKRFKLPSKVSGMIASMYDLGATFAVLIVAYFGGTHKTRWIGLWSMGAGFACFTYYLPHMLYGAEQSFDSTGATNFSTRGLCQGLKGIEENCSLNTEGQVATLVFIVAGILMGIGGSSFYTLGAAYLDDNVLKNKFPLFFLSVSLPMIATNVYNPFSALVSLARSFGATLGFMVSSYCLSYYIDPNVTPDYNKEDPRWVGAWYKGWIPFGAMEVILAFSILFFPKTLRREAERRRKRPKENIEPKHELSLKDFKQAMYRLLTNKIFMLNTFSTTFFIFAEMGWWTFMSKYIETQFRVSASESNFLLGSTGLLFAGLGMMTSGAIISLLKPRPRLLASWNVIADIINSACILGFAFLGCFKEDLHGTMKDNGQMDLIKPCNSNCNCSTSIEYSPVCSMDQLTTYFSPCHAGCSTFSVINGTKLFSNCSCIAGLGQATDGACPVDCTGDFFIFMTLHCLGVFFSSTGQAGNTVVQYRSVLPEDKSLSIAITEFVFAILAFVPAPIIYGSLLDSSCMVWGETCNKTGNCWIYHGLYLRQLLCATTIGFLIIGTLLDVGVVYEVGSLQMYDKEEDISDDKNQHENLVPLMDVKND